MDKYQLISQPVPKLFFQYLIPAVSGTMVSAVYILADTIIIGKGIGATALAALNIVLPLFNIIYGAGLLFGVGGSVLMSICRGRGHDEKGQRYFTAAFLLNLLAGILYISVFFIFVNNSGFFRWNTRHYAVYYELRALSVGRGFISLFFNISSGFCP